MSKNKKQVIPKLRFIDFKDDERWDITTFGKLSIPVEERAGEDSYTLMSVTSGVGLIPQIEKFGREIAGNSYKNYYVIQNDDFAYNKSATKLYPEGYIAMLQGYDNAALPNSIFTCFRIVDKGSSPQFFNYLFSSNYHGKWLRKYITLGARANGALSVDNKYLWKMPVAVPKLNEQQKIAECLVSLDELISAEDEKLLALKDQKKGLMQKLFPAEGNSLPEWRFPEFRSCGEWELKTIRNTCASYSGGTPDTSIKKYYGGKIPFIRSGEIAKKITELFLTDEGLQNSSAKKVAVGDVLVALYGANSGEVALSKIDGAINQAILCLKHESNNAFVYHYLSHKKQWIIKTYIQGGQGNLAGEIIKSVELYFPKLPEEQQKIAACLSGFDDLITTQSEKIEALKLHKIALIQGLFPSAQEVFE